MKEHQKKRKLNIVAINTVDYGSTGRIMKEIANYVRDKGHNYQTFSVAKRDKSKPAEYHTYYMSFYGYMIHYVLGRITGFNGFFSVIPTIRLVRTLQRVKPTVLHLHNLHGFNINLPILFSYLKKCNIPIVWTMHDCWLFTGHCAHYDMIGCKKWETGCYECPLYKDYPESNVDNSKLMWKYKKEQINSILKLTLVTPSHWLANQLKQSFLNGNNVRVIHNGINLDVFKPTTSDFRNKYNLGGKYIVLGVAFGWGEKKGLDIFQKLSVQLSDKYKVVLVGTTEQIDKFINHEIITIHKTNDQNELAGIYSAADVFVNPTREDTFPTVNIEALACGTPVITFRTGGSPEIIDDYCGITVDKDDYSSLENAIVRACEKERFQKDDCIRRAHLFNSKKCYSEYLKLYEQISEGIRNEQ